MTNSLKDPEEDSGAREGFNAKDMEAWQGALDQLRLQLDGSTFDRWLRNALLLRVEHPTPLPPSPTQPDVWVIGLRTELAVQACAAGGGLHRSIRRILSDMLDVSPDALALFFEVSTPASAAESVPPWKLEARKQLSNGRAKARMN